jgi:hypothetical protein
MDNKKDNTKQNTAMPDIDKKPKVKVTDMNNVKAKKPNLRDKLATKSAMLHTYKQDVEGLVRKRKVSLVNVMSMQMDKTGRQEAKIEKDGSLIVNTMDKTNRKDKAAKLIIIASVLMLSLGAVALLIAYSAYKIQLQNTTQDKTRTLADDTIIFVEHRAHINVTDRLPRETLTELTKILSISGATLGSITQIIPEWSAWDDALGRRITFIISQEQLIKLLGLTLPDQFTRLLGDPGNYMIGMHVADRNVPFILLTTRSYEHAFAGMLEWENDAEVQLSPLFKTNGSGSSKRIVEDIVVQNIDARVVRDDARNLKFLYAFLDKNTILITNNIHTLTEVARRYKVRKASGTADIPSEFIR